MVSLFGVCVWWDGAVERLSFIQLKELLYLYFKISSFMLKRLAMC